MACCRGENPLLGPFLETEGNLCRILSPTGLSTKPLVLRTLRGVLLVVMQCLACPPACRHRGSSMGDELKATSVHFGETGVTQSWEGSKFSPVLYITLDEHASVPGLRGFSFSS
jgi:hypothetical protein